MPPVDHQAVNDEIFSKIDFASEYASMGVEITNSTPRPSGWIECRAYGREDRRQSAAIHSQNGRYLDKGTGESLSFWDFCVKVGRFSDWKDARKHFAEKFAVRVDGRGRPKKSPDEQIEIVKWNPNLERMATVWCDKHKPGCTLESMLVNGVKPAQYPKKSKQHLTFSVPIFGPSLLNAPPVAYQIWDSHGGKLPVWGKDGGKPVDHIRIKSIGPVSGGLMGSCALAQLLVGVSDDVTIWICEGPTDLFALFAMIPEELRSKHLVIANAGGSTEHVLPHIVSLLAGHRVYVLRDCDYAGEAGAIRWCSAFEHSASEVKWVKLPYEVTSKHGKDVRDFACEHLRWGDGFDCLLEIAAAIEPFDSGKVVIPDRAAASPSPSSSSSTPAPPQPDDHGEAGAAEGSDVPIYETNGHETNSHESNIHESNGHGDSHDPLGLADDSDRPAAPIEPIVERIDQNTNEDSNDTYERMILSAIQLKVIGEYPNGWVYAFSSHPSRRNTTDIRDPDRLTFARLLQLCGPPVRELVREDESVKDEGGGSETFTVSEVRNAICFVAGQRRLGEQSLSGVGVWNSLNAEGEEDEKSSAVILVGKGEAAKWNGSKKLERYFDPEIGGRLLQLNNSEAWYDHATLADYIQKATPQWAQQVIEETSGVFDRWRWQSQSHYPMVVTGLIMATFVQTIWAWRPQAAITGRTNTGKSTFFDCLSKVFGQLASRSSKSTAAGIRQTIQSSARVILIDEFERSRHRDDILEMIRAASRGDSIRTGTTNQRGMEFLIRHIIWVAAIEIGLKRAPDRNRFIMLELLPAKAGEHGTLKCPPDDYLYDLGHKLLAIAVRNIHQARAMAIRLKARQHAGCDPRIVESYAVPAAMLAVSMGWDDVKADGGLADMLGQVPADDHTASDEEDVIQAILRSVVRIDRSHELTVSEILAERGSDNMRALERHGLGICYHNRGRRPVATADRRIAGENLFIDHKDVTHKLLKGTDWQFQSIDQILQRVDGAEKRRARIGSRIVNGVSIPMQYLVRFARDSEDEPGSDFEVVDHLNTPLEPACSDDRFLGA